MPHEPQVEAAMLGARATLQQARQYEVEGKQIEFVRSLGTACEYACRALAVSWGDPRASRRKLIEFVRDYLNDYVSVAEREFIQLIWDQGEDVIPTSSLVDAAGKVIEHFLQLATQGPPVGWTPPTYPVLSWDQLTDTEQTFMNQMLAIARYYGGPGTRVYLHGSRSKGQATADSDYDVLAIFPNEVLNIWPGQAMGRMVEVAQSQGVMVSQYWFYRSVWDDPSTTDDPILVEQVKRYGIEVPNSDS